MIVQDSIEPSCWGSIGSASSGKPRMTTHPDLSIVECSRFVLLLTCLQNCQALYSPLVSPSLNVPIRPTNAADAALAGIRYTQYPPTTSIPITEPGTLGVSEYLEVLQSTNLM